MLPLLFLKTLTAHLTCHLAPVHAAWLASAGFGLDPERDRQCWQPCHGMHQDGVVISPPTLLPDNEA